MLIVVVFFAGIANNWFGMNPGVLGDEPRPGGSTEHLQRVPAHGMSNFVIRRWVKEDFVFSVVDVGIAVGFAGEKSIPLVRFPRDRPGMGVFNRGDMRRAGEDGGRLGPVVAGGRQFRHGLSVVLSLQLRHRFSVVHAICLVHVCVMRLRTTYVFQG